LKKQNINFKTYIEPTSLKKKFFIVIRKNLHNYTFSLQEKSHFMAVFCRHKVEKTAIQWENVTNLAAIIIGRKNSR
jgi:hypothetical protein